MVMVGYRASNSVIAVSNPWSLLGRRISGWRVFGSALFTGRLGLLQDRRTVSRPILSVRATPRRDAPPRNRVTILQATAWVMMDSSFGPTQRSCSAGDSRRGQPGRTPIARQIDSEEQKTGRFGFEGPDRRWFHRTVDVLDTPRDFTASRSSGEHRCQSPTCPTQAASPSPTGKTSPALYAPSRGLQPPTSTTNSAIGPGHRTRRTEALRSAGPEDWPGSGRRPALHLLKHHLL